MVGFVQSMLHRIQYTITRYMLNMFANKRIHTRRHMNADKDDLITDAVSQVFKRPSITSAADHDEFVESTKHERRAITVEPLVLFYIIVLYLQTSVLNQYIYYRIGIDYNITTNSTHAFVCDPNANGSAEKDKTDKIQDINTSYGMYIAMVSALSTICTCPFYSVFSDRFGRRLLFFIPGLGSMIKSLFEVLIIVFNWPIYSFVFTEGLFGLFGGFNFALGLSYSYIADVSTTKNRTKRLSILVSMMGIGALAVSLITGIWITKQGYLIPYAFSAAVSVLCFVYPVLFLKEPPRMEEATRIKLPPLKQLRTLVSIYIGRPREQTVILVLVVIMFNFYYVAEMSTFGIVGTYLMSFPLCMTAMQMSFFSFLNIFAINVGVAVSVIILSRFMPELIIVLICHVSGFCFAIQMAFTTGAVSAMIAAASNLFSFSAFQFVRGFLSKEVGPFEQGALFGGLALCESISSAITKIIVVYFYKETFHKFHGMVYLLIASFSVVAFILTVVILIIDRRFKNRAGFNKLN